MNQTLIKIGFIASLAGFVVGFNSTFSGALPSIIEYYKLSGGILGITVSIMVIGCLTGGLVATWFTRIYGFKKVLFVAGFILFVSPLWSSLITNLGWFMLSRALLGIGYSIAIVLTPVYLAEIAPSYNRGRLVTYFQLSIVLGILLSYLASYYLSGILNDWRWMLAIPSVPAIVYAILIRWIPESPRWLVAKGKERIAYKILSRVSNNEYAKKELEGIQINKKSVSNGKFKDLFSKKYRKVIITGALLTLFQQMTGIAAILTFIPIIFQQMGSNHDQSFLNMIYVGFVNFIFTLVAVRYTDSWGRKPLMNTGLTLIVFSLSAISVLYFLNISTTYLSLVFMLIYIASFAASNGPLLWVILSEIFPARVKTRALTIATVSYWLSVGFTGYLFPILMDRLGGGFTFALFAFSTIAHIVFIIKYIPETRGKSLEEIEKIMVDSN